MTTWRDLALLHFRPPATHLSLVADPDGLLLEEQVLAALNARGCDLLTFDNPIAFRYLYETRYRDQPAPALIVRIGQADARQLPYDLLQAGRQISLTLHDICPQLSYPVVRDFFRAAPDLLDTLLDASRAAQGARLSEQRSLGFLARHVYGLDPASLAGPDDLVERLLHIHYHGWTLPERLQGWLVGQLRRSPAFADQPVERWLADRRAFFIFLEDQWRSYLRQQGQTLAQSESLAEPGPPYQLAPLAVDFSRPGIRSRVDTLFLENKLRPALVIAERPPQDWTAVGVTVDAAAHRSQRLARLLAHVEREVAQPRRQRARLARSGPGLGRGCAAGRRTARPVHCAPATAGRGLPGLATRALRRPAQPALPAPAHPRPPGRPLPGPPPAPGRCLGARRPAGVGRAGAGPMADRARRVAGSGPALALG